MDYQYFGAISIRNLFYRRYKEKVLIYTLVLIATAAYVLFIIILIIGWIRTPATNLLPASGSFATIVVPVRNESSHLTRLINSVLKGSTEPSQYEILIVNDHSEDDTLELAEQLADKNSNILVLDLPEQMHGKKAAINHAVQQANGELIVCTDGDGIVPKDWLNYHMSSFEQGAELSFGPVAFLDENHSRFTELLNLELSALVSIGAATLSLGKPSMINGCNYSFSKTAFLEVDGFLGNENLPTGDDEFLLRKVFKKYPGKIRFIKQDGAQVLSQSPLAVTEFYHQRKRWASKWRFHTDGFSLAMPAILFTCYALWLLLVLQSMATNNYSPLWVLGVKFLTDFVFLNIARLGQNAGISIVNFFLLQIIYPFYVVFFGVASNFGKYSWRERTYKI
ncbi:MAG: glycosyltransferase [Reichenbachiella sp.]|uniref:glycosyltransferase n=1 Tax=Reichenbachiella sp. TaxID=2184521 RepID=UPI003267C721